MPPERRERDRVRVGREREVDIGSQNGSIGSAITPPANARTAAAVRRLRPSPSDQTSSTDAATTRITRVVDTGQSGEFQHSQRLPPQFAQGAASADGKQHKVLRRFDTMTPEDVKKTIDRGGAVTVEFQVEVYLQAVLIFLATPTTPATPEPCVDTTHANWLQ